MKHDLVFDQYYNIMHSNECCKVVVKDEVNASIEVEIESHSP